MWFNLSILILKDLIVAFTDASGVKFSFTVILYLLVDERQQPCAWNNSAQAANGSNSQLCKTDMINMNDIQLLNTSEGFAPDFWCHVEYKIILYCHGSGMVNEKLSFVSMLLINWQPRQPFLVHQHCIYFSFYIPLSFYLLLKYRVCLKTAPNNLNQFRELPFIWQSYHHFCRSFPMAFLLTHF